MFLKIKSTSFFLLFIFWTPQCKSSNSFLVLINSFEIYSPRCPNLILIDCSLGFSPYSKYDIDPCFVNVKSPFNISSTHTLHLPFNSHIVALFCCAILVMFLKIFRQFKYLSSDKYISILFFSTSKPVSY